MRVTQRVLIGVVIVGLLATAAFATTSGMIDARAMSIARALFGTSGTNGQVWTKDATVMANGKWSDAGGGSSIVHQATVTLNNAQIKALPSTQQTIVTAPGSNKLIVPTKVMYVSDTIAGAYTNISIPADGAYLYIAWDTYDIDFGLQNAEASAPFGGNVTTVDTLLGSGSSIFMDVPTPVAFYYGSGLWAAHSNFTADGTNKALKLDCFNNDGDFTGGHDDNTVVVSVTYLILNISTGVFE